MKEDFLKAIAEKAVELPSIQEAIETLKEVVIPELRDQTLYLFVNILVQAQKYQDAYLVADQISDLYLRWKSGINVEQSRDLQGVNDALDRLQRDQQYARSW